MVHLVKKFEAEGLVLIASDLFKDDRGYFVESYKESEFMALGLPKFVQDNFSFSKKHVLRGLHYQLPPKAQGKLVRVLEGKIWDVAVDIRKGSGTFGTVTAVELTEESGQAFYVPEGFAHGFLVLSNFARVLYKTTSEYQPELERGVVWNDPELKIPWPVPNPIIAPRDAAFPLLKNVQET